MSTGAASIVAGSARSCSCPAEPTPPLLPIHNWISIGPHFANRDYRWEPDVVFLAVEQVLVERGWRRQIVDRARWAIAASTHDLPNAAYRLQEIAAFAVPTLDSECRVRFGLQYSGRARAATPHAYEPMFERDRFLQALDAHLDGR